MLEKKKLPEDLLKEMFPKRVKRIAPSKEIYVQLKNMILTGELKKGEKLIQEKIAQRCDVSRSAVIPVFTKLKKEGLIDSRQRAGTVVK